jgi:hypothetical protein
MLCEEKNISLNDRCFIFFIPTSGIGYFSSDRSFNAPSGGLMNSNTAPSGS